MAEILEERTGRELFEEHYDVLAPAWNDAPAWLRDLRRDAMTRFSELDLPTARLEEWRQTRVEALRGTSFAVEAPVPTPEAIEEGLRQYDIPELGGARLVFINGRFSPEHSRIEGLPVGTVIRPLSEALVEDGGAIEPFLGRLAPWQDHAFAALNTALFTDGLFLSLPTDSVIERPIHLLHLNGGGERPFAMHTRNLILVGSGAKGLLVESYGALDGSVYFTNSVTEVEMGRDSYFDHHKIQRESAEAFHFQSMGIHQHSGSKFDAHAMTEGGILGRNDIYAHIDGEHCDTILNGLYMLTGNQMFDTHTLLDHARPHCHSREIYKGILNGHSKAVFRGKILVRQHAQKTDAVQSSKNLLLSHEAQVNAQPQLEIYADDVKCTHGATIGQLDPDALFYAKTRGLSEVEAKALLTFAFANDNLYEVVDETVREHLEGRIHHWLEQHGAPEEE